MEQDYEIKVPLTIEKCFYSSWVIIIATLISFFIMLVASFQFSKDIDFYRAESGKVSNEQITLNIDGKQLKVDALGYKDETLCRVYLDKENKVIQIISMDAYTTFKQNSNAMLTRGIIFSFTTLFIGIVICMVLQVPIVQWKRRNMIA